MAIDRKHTLRQFIVHLQILFVGDGPEGGHGESTSGTLSMFGIGILVHAHGHSLLGMTSQSTGTRHRWRQIRRGGHIFRFVGECVGRGGRVGGMRRAGDSR